MNVFNNNFSIKVRVIKKVRSFLLLCVLIISVPILKAQEIPNRTLNIEYNRKAGAFPLISREVVPSILIDQKDAEVVRVSAEALSDDLNLVGGKKPLIINEAKGSSEYLVIAGTVGHSEIIDKLIKENKIDVKKIQSKWECYSIAIVNSPLKNVKQALVVAGSDRRGTAYGLFEISRMAGVSPWVWWADVKPAKQKSIYVSSGSFVSQEPSVKYRGIFINDEDWGIQPWAAKNLDSEVKDIGPKTYAKVFELLLRLRANFIWPAMHECTKAFWYYPDNPKLADRYAIILGASHCEPMLRNNVYEWTENFEHEYGVKPGAWRYDQNKEQIYRYWNDRVDASKNIESVYTVGMRGIHDGSMPGPKDRAGKIELLGTVIKDQRNIIKQYFGGTNAAPQIFCPYKEVLQLYQGGVKVPDDITMVWADDNFGYVRQLSNPQEQTREGRSGVYYHISYYGAPHDYLWLSTTSPSQISFEMTKSFQFGADRLWVLNVGDIKPGEMETQFFLDMAWNIDAWKPENASNYSKYWATQVFGDNLASDIAELKNEYYRLAQSGRPEHLLMLRYSDDVMTERLDAYTRLVERVDRVKQRVPAELRSAFFQLIEYPVKGASLMNEKVFYAQMSLNLASKKDQKALQMSLKSQAAFEKIKSLTNYFNVELEGGKWNGMMSDHPRNLPVFRAPMVANKEMIESGRVPSIKDKSIDSIAGQTVNEKPISVSGGIIYASKFNKTQPKGVEKIIVVPGLGNGGQSITRYPFTGIAYQANEIEKAPFVEYKVPLKAGSYKIKLYCLPTHAIHSGRNLKMAISINKGETTVLDVNNKEEDRTWKMNVLRGFSEASLPLINNQPDSCTIRIYLLDTGLALNKLEILKDN